MFPIPEPVSGPTKQQVAYPSNDGFRIGVTPGAVVGAMVGGAIANHNVKKKNAQRIADEKAEAIRNAPGVEGNYYNQVQQVAENLNVVFSPMSAVFVVRNKDKDFTLDTIEVSEMSQDMKMAWKAKDENYFKGLMMNKMLTEMQIAEQSFAKSFVKRQIGIKDMVTKEASDTAFLDNIREVELFETAIKTAGFFVGGEIKEKLANAVINDMENEEEIYSINPKLDRPLNKYAGVVSGITSSLGLHSSKEDFDSVKKKLENPKHTMKHVKIGFFPDRVVFSLDNQLISTLSLMSMNEEGYEHFMKQDSRYFRNLFSEQAKELMKKATVVSIESAFEKIANESVEEVIENCLLSSDTHPVALYMFMISKMGVEWLQYDIAVIENIVKSEFELEYIPETNINKIIGILMANQSDSPYTNAYAFEKIVLSMCSKPVDFLEEQKSSINVQDIVFTIDVMDRVTPHDDIYDNFSVEVINYIADTLANKDMYIYSPANIISSPTEPAFTELVNESLLKFVKSKMTISSDNKELDEEINNNCEYIADSTLSILKSYRRAFSDNQTVMQINRGDLVEAVMSKKSLRDDVRNIIKRQVIISLALDDILTMFENTLKEQVGQYNITRPEEE